MHGHGRKCLLLKERQREEKPAGRVQLTTFGMTVSKCGMGTKFTEKGCISWIHKMFLRSNNSFLGKDGFLLHEIESILCLQIQGLENVCFMCHSLADNAILLNFKTKQYAQAKYLSVKWLHLQLQSKLKSTAFIAEATPFKPTEFYSFFYLKN